MKIHECKINIVKDTTSKEYDVLKETEILHKEIWIYDKCTPTLLGE